MKYLIIGLGHYGATLAMELTAMGHEVVGADGDGLHVDSVKDQMAASFVLDATDEMALSVLPLKSVDAVIVAIGDNFGASVRIVSLLKKLKVKRIYARAVDEVHKGVLEAFSIDRILTPEQDAARLLAQQLELDGGAEFFQIDGNTYVFKLEIPEKLVGYHINELNLEQEFGLKHDPSLFQDTDGKIWLISKCAEIQQLKPDFTGFIGKPVAIHPANRKMGHEGCQIIKIGNKYVWFGTAWSKDTLRKGTYNLYYATADKIEGPYSNRKFAGRCLGHGTIFKDKNGNWWCTAFLNGDYKSPTEVNKGVNPNIATSMNKQGLTLVPMSIEIKDNDIVVKALDPQYAQPGAEENQKF